MKLSILLALLFFFITPALSGTMVKVGVLNLPPDSHPNSQIGCSHKFEGAIQQGDIQKFNIVEPGQTITVVCLDSPGGSLKEATKIAEFLKKNNIGTKLEANARCESACAIIFMAGSYYAHEVGSLHWRIMHPKSRLGFHSPALLVANGSYDKASVEKAYELAMQSVSEIIFKLVSFEGFEGGDSMKASLLGEMMRTPSSKMFMIDTVDKAGRWDIMVGPTRNINNLSDKQFYRACHNIQYWDKDESAIVSYELGNFDMSGTVKRTIENGQLNVEVIFDEFTGEKCTFTTNERRPTTASPIWVQDRHARPNVYIGTFLPSETKLSALAVCQRQSQCKVP